MEKIQQITDELCAAYNWHMAGEPAKAEKFLMSALTGAFRLFS